MALSPRMRRLALTIHVASSVGWLGSVAAFLVLAVVGLTSHDQIVVRCVYVAMAPLTDILIVPLNGAALLTGIISALGTPWGLFRHWWVLMKLILTTVGTLLLALHMQLIELLSSAAASAATLSPSIDSVRTQLAFDSAAAVVLLLVITTLSIFKPRGMTRYGRRRQNEERLALRKS